jgi:hypothetical protein
VRNTAVNVLGARVAADAVLPALRDRRGTLLSTGGGYALHPLAARAGLLNRSADRGDCGSGQMTACTASERTTS